MMDSTTIPANNVSFKNFLLKDKRNKTILILAAVAIVIQFGVFKYFYPFASYIHDDSFEYLNTAYYNLDINIYMVGYSRFLRLFSVFTSSDTILTSFQYLLLQSSALFLLFTIFYLNNPGRTLQTVLLCFVVFNPLFLHLANLISSDGLFVTLSLIWFTLLLWIIHRPTNSLIILNGVILFFAFTVRYNALLYPLISIIAFGLSPISFKRKILGFSLGLSLCLLFVIYTGAKYKQLTGHWQYAPFSGWQWANNAMYAYRYVDSSERKTVPKRFEKLNKFVTDFFDATRDTTKYPFEAIQASTFYMWSRGMPLMRYRDSIFKKDIKAPELKSWASMGPIYKKYGTWLIKKYPMHFAKYFLWPNANKYYAPPVEFLGSYNGGQDSIWLLAKNWFGYKSRKLSTRTKDLNVTILNFYPILSGIINVLMLSNLVCFLLLKGWKQKKSFSKGILLAGVIWLLNALFTISASSVALRFQAFPIILTVIFATFILNWMVELMAMMKKEESTNENKNINEGFSQRAIV